MELMSVAELANMARLMAIPIFLSFVGLVVLMSDLIFNLEEEQRWPAYLTIAGLAGSLFLWVQSWLVYHPSANDNAFFGFVRELLRVQALEDIGERPQMLFNGMYDPVGPSNLTLLVSLLVILVALVITLIAPRYLERRGLQRGEFYALMIFSAVGLIFMAGSQHLIMIFLAIELLSIPLYILAGFARPQLRSQEAALKYFLLGAFASGFLLYGIALTYGATGSMSLPEIRQILSSDLNQLFSGGSPSVLMVNGGPNYMLVGALAMLLVGIGFKISVVPFHQWTPDVYEGSPTPVTAFMVAGTKIGGFAVLLNLLLAFTGLFKWWAILLNIFALLTMAVGNIGALQQTNIKRMLAYSSIAHAGYMLVGVAGLGTALSLGIGPDAILQTLILYLAVYALMNLGTFAVLLALEEATGREIVELEDFRGLGRQHPVLGFLLGFFLLSLAGFPPTAGFFAKFFLFTAAILGNQLWLVLIAVVLSVLSLFYYARYIVAMFMETGEEKEDAQDIVRASPSLMVRTAVLVTAALVLMIGLFPNPFLELF
ncbi:MAG: NADH-quinone oxidoreductase subunit N [Ardenticatenaceae bacterium]